MDESGNVIPTSKSEIKITRHRAYSYKNGDKTFFKCEADIVGFSTNRAVCDNYDVIYSVDTNTKEIASEYMKKLIM